MNPSESLNHTKWECKYHIVWIPKYRKKTIFKELRPYLGEMLKDLAAQKGCTIIEGHLLSDHVHICVRYRRNMPCRRSLVSSKGKVLFG